MPRLAWILVCLGLASCGSDDTPSPTTPETRAAPAEKPSTGEAAASKSAASARAASKPAATKELAPEAPAARAPTAKPEVARPIAAAPAPPRGQPFAGHFEVPFPERPNFQVVSAAGEKGRIAVANYGGQTWTLSVVTHAAPPPGFGGAAWRKSQYAPMRVAGDVEDERTKVIAGGHEALVVRYRAGSQRLTAALFAVERHEILLSVAGSDVGAAGAALERALDAFRVVTPVPPLSREPALTPPRSATPAKPSFGASCNLMTTLRQCFETSHSALGKTHYASVERCKGEHVFSSATPCPRLGRTGACVLPGAEQVAHFYHEAEAAARTCAKLYGGTWQAKGEGPGPWPVNRGGGHAERVAAAPDCKLEAHHACGTLAACTKACDAKDPKACFALVRAYFRGDCVPEDKAMQGVFEGKACEAGRMASCESYGRILARAGDLAKGEAVLKRACEHSNEHCWSLGEHQQKAGDLAAACATFRRACKSGDSFSCKPAGALASHCR